MLGEPGQDDDDFQSWFDDGLSKPRSSAAHKGDGQMKEAEGKELADWFEDRVERLSRTPPQQRKQPSNAHAHVQPPHTHTSPAATAQSSLLGLGEHGAHGGKPVAQDSLIDFGTASENGSSDVNVDDLLGLDMQQESSLAAAGRHREKVNGGDAFGEEHLQMFGGGDAEAGGEEWEADDNACEGELEDSLGELQLQSKLWAGCEAHAWLWWPSVSYARFCVSFKAYCA